MRIFLVAPVSVAETELRQEFRMMGFKIDGYIRITMKNDTA